MVHRRAQKPEEEDIVMEPAESEHEREEIEIEEQAEQKITKLREELKRCQEERKEYLDGWQRLKADMLNSKRRQEESRVQDRERETALLIEKILPLCDSFEMALRGERGEENIWRTGMEQIYQQLQSILSGYGVSLIRPNGESFDPNRHEAISEVVVPTEAEHGVITEVLQSGYALGARIIRPAKVVVGRYET